MSALTLTLVLLSVLLGTAAQLLLKLGTNAVGPFAFTADNLVPMGLKLALDPRILAGAGLYFASFVIWIMALSRTEVSVAHPMVSLGFALNAVLAWWLLGEAVTPMRMAGIGVIIIGVFLVARS